MSRCFVLQVTGVGVSLPKQFSQFSENFAVGFGATVTGTGTYSVEFSYADQAVSGFVATTSSATTSGVWFMHSGVSGAAVAANGSFLAPIGLMRINVLTASAGFAVTCSGYQAGPGVG